MSLHAPLEQSDDETIVWVLSEAEASAIMHKLFEFIRLILAKLFNAHFLLLFLDICIFLLL